jgi:putative transposase
MLFKPSGKAARSQSSEARWEAGQRGEAADPRRPGLTGPGVPHLERQGFASRKAVHVTQRVRPSAGYLRRHGPSQVVLKAFADAAERGGMRIAHYSIQGNHLHLIVEAESATALSRGMQGLSVRIARRLNRHLGRQGPVFADRYHSHLLTSRRALANAVRYVIGNYRHHAREYVPTGFRDPLATRPDQPLAPPRLWLLSTGWRLEPPRKSFLFEPP